MPSDLCNDMLSMSLGLRVSINTHRAGITLYGLSKELPGCDEDAGEEEDAGGDLVEKLEAPVVDADLLQLQEAANCLPEGPQQLGHWWCSGLQVRMVSLQGWGQLTQDGDVHPLTIGVWRHVTSNNQTRQPGGQECHTELQSDSFYWTKYEICTGKLRV